MPKISLLLPTRGRPHLVQRIFQSLISQTANLEDIEVVLYVDDDDDRSHSLDCDGVRLVKIIGPRLSHGGYNTACLNRSSGEIIILMNDDVIVRTPGWDRIIIELAGTVPDGIFLAYANDLHMGKRMCTFPIVTRRACEVMARPYPGEYQGGFIDWHLLDVFKRLKYKGYDRIFYLDQVVFEHLHFDSGKAEFDLTYQNRERYEGDWTFVCLRELRQATATRLHAAIMGEPLPPLPHESGLPSRPRNSIRVLLRYASVFFLDFALPVSERVRLFVWLTGRYLRIRGYLPPKRPAQKAD